MSNHEQYHNFALQFLDLIPTEEGQTVLDLGCGRGLQSQWFHNKGLNVIGGDIEKFDEYPWDFDFQIVNGEKMQFPDRSFDIVWSHHVLEHIINPMECLMEVRRVMRDDGWFYLTVPQIDDIVSGGHINSFNLPVLIYKLVVCGFDCRNAYFMKQNSHLRVAVQKNMDYNPKVDGIRIELSAHLDVLPESIIQSIKETGRFNYSHLKTKWLDGTERKYSKL